jgi:hypothetical protein
MESNLFIVPVSKQIPILLIDASGSVVLNRFNDKDVLDQIKVVIKNLPEEEFRIIFWNSDNEKQVLANDKFKGGICKLPFVVKKNTIDQTFAYVKPSIFNGCLTFPSIAFDHVPNEWIHKTDPTKIYFVTDGEIGYSSITQQSLTQLKMNLSNSITKLFQQYNKLQLVIITVEPKNMDFNQIETLNSAAGCDVYNVIMDNRLTKYVTQFVSYTLNNLNGFFHINKNIPPVGFIPYGNKYFSELRMNDFIMHIIEVINNISNNDDELLKIIQLLSSSICVLIKDKPPRVQKDIINTFCGLFRATSLDVTFVRFIITDAINKENDGTANVFAKYRAKLKDLYKQAGELLLTNVKEAIGINDSFLTLPIKDNNGEYKMVSGNYRLVDLPLVLSNKNYPSAAISVNNITLPIIPFDYELGQSLMNEQCLRQWTRLLISKLYNVNIMEDIIIYVTLGISLQVTLSDVSEDVKNCYRKLGHVMLNKKRTNTDRTELDRLECGELPIPNSGKIEGFYKFMDFVNNQLGLKLNPMSLWYILCLALNNDALIKNQYMHCKEFLDMDFPNVNPKNLLSTVKDMVRKITHIEIPFETVLDYTCLITLENTAEKGGHRFLPHNSMIGTLCCPVYVLSEEGYNELLNSNPICPICYANISAANFEIANPKPSINGEVNIFSEETVNVFAIQKYNKPSNPIVVNPNVNNTSLRLKKNGLLIILKAVVGGGKSTYTAKLKEEYEKQGKHFFVAGTDVYCKDGDTMLQAIEKIKQNLLTINDIGDDESVIVCIDTCNEHTTNKTTEIFGVNFAGWNKITIWPNLINRNDLKGYLSWSLRNVLNREATNSESKYWLNPVNAGVSTCIMVHKKNAIAHFGKKIPELFYGSPATKEKALELIKAEADKYALLIETQKPLDMEIQKIVQG